MNTLVYHSGALGDFITILPLLETWKKLTNANIILLGKPEHGTLAQMSGYIDETLDMDRKCQLVFFSLSDSYEIEKRLLEFSHIILFAFQNSPITINCKKYFSGSLLIQNPFPSAGIHAIDYHCQLISEILPHSDTVYPKVNIENTCLKDKSKTVVIHPGSGSSRKNWPFAKFSTLADKIRNCGYSIFWITGPAEENLIFNQNDTLYSDLSLIDVSKVLRQCTIYIGNDSGITHLAAACGCAVIALFGPSDPLVWSPRGERDMTVFYKKKDCSPCHPFSIPDLTICKAECLNQISPDEVFTAFNKQLSTM